MSAKPNPKDVREKNAEGISAISVCGYKSISREQRAEIRPLTILAGANSSGKSSLMQPLLLLKQTLEVGYEPGRLVTEGPNVVLMKAQEAVSRVRATPVREGFSVGVELRRGRKLRLTLTTRESEPFQVSQMVYEGSPQALTLRRDMEEKEIESLVKQWYHGTEPPLPTPRASHVRWEVQRAACFLKVVRQYAEQPSYGVLKFYQDLISPSSDFEPHIRGLIHVPGLRRNVTPTQYVAAVDTGLFRGTFDNYVGSIINQWQTTSNPSLSELGRNLEKLGLTSRVQAVPIGQTQIELRVARLPRAVRRGTTDFVGLADVGFGVSQVLPVLVALLAAAPGQLVYLEQPELHLHPRAQTELAGLLADAAKRGVRVVAETHSSLLLLGIQTLVAEGKLSPDLVKLHWFKRDNRGATKVMPGDLDKAGAFGDWPEDFGDVELKAQSRFLDASEKRLVEG